MDKEENRIMTKEEYLEKELEKEKVEKNQLLGKLAVYEKIAFEKEDPGEEIKEIKVVWNHINCSGSFNKEVNDYLKEGFTIKEIKVNRPKIEGLKSIFYAILVKYKGVDD